MALFEIFDPKALPRPIGIDLGTTNSLVAYVANERPVAIADCDLAVLVPSVVAYLPSGDVVVGRRAKGLAAEHPRDTIVSVKRFMGRGADDPETRRLGPYEFASPEPGEANTVRFRVGEGRTVTPVEVSAEITYEDGRKTALRSRLSIGDVDDPTPPTAVRARRAAPAPVAAE